MKIYKTTPEQRAAARQWQKENPERFAYITRRWRYSKRGKTVEQVDSLLTAQGGACAVCGGSPKGKKGWHLDHEHCTGHVRGVLCHSCNVALGHLKDDPARCRAAAVYLERHAQMESLL